MAREDDGIECVGCGVVCYDDEVCDCPGGYGTPDLLDDPDQYYEVCDDEIYFDNADEDAELPDGA